MNDVRRFVNRSFSSSTIFLIEYGRGHDFFKFEICRDFLDMVDEHAELA